MQENPHNNIIIRPAEPRDIPAVTALLAGICLLHCEGRPDIFRPGVKYSAGELETIFADPKTPVLVAERGVETVAGYLFCIIKRQNHPVLREITTLYIDDLCVSPAARGQGIGRLLFGAAKELARRIGAYNIDLNVWIFNTGAVKFYENLGMKPSRQIMELILDPPGGISGD